MAWRRFYISADVLNGEAVQIDGDLFHHIRDVCRFQVGDKFEVLPGDGRAVLVEISDIGTRELAARVQSARVLPEPPKPRVTLALSVPKLPKVDWIVEKCVELGVHEIRPFVSEFSYLRKLSDISANRMQRWQKLAQGATQQSGRGDLLKLRDPVTLPDLLQDFNRSAATGGLFAYEGEARRSIASAAKELQNRNLDHIWLFVGSEGGFSASEVQLFERNGLAPVSLGQQILRVETACLALVSIIKYQTGAFET